MTTYIQPMLNSAIHKALSSSPSRATVTVSIVTFFTFFRLLVAPRLRRRWQEQRLQEHLKRYPYAVVASAAAPTPKKKKSSSKRGASAAGDGETLQSTFQYYLVQAAWKGIQIVALLSNCFTDVGQYVMRKLRNVWNAIYQAFIRQITRRRRREPAMESPRSTTAESGNESLTPSAVPASIATASTRTTTTTTAVSQQAPRSVLKKRRSSDSLGASRRSVAFSEHSNGQVRTQKIYYNPQQTPDHRLERRQHQQPQEQQQQEESSNALSPEGRLAIPTRQPTPQSLLRQRAVASPRTSNKENTNVPITRTLSTKGAISHSPGRRELLKSIGPLGNAMRKRRMQLQKGDNNHEDGEESSGKRRKYNHMGRVPLSLGASNRPAPRRRNKRQLQEQEDRIWEALNKKVKPQEPTKVEPTIVAAQSAPQPAFEFGSTPAKTPPAGTVVNPKPSFEFGSTPANTPQPGPVNATDGAKDGGVQFGAAAAAAAKPNDDSKPSTSIQFGANTPATSITFGTSTPAADSKPEASQAATGGAFQFGAAAATTSDAPATNAASTSADSSKPAAGGFQFSASTTFADNSKPAFQFGASSSDPASSNAHAPSTTPAPTGGFQFSGSSSAAPADSSKPGFQFGAATSADPNAPSTTPAPSFEASSANATTPSFGNNSAATATPAFGSTNAMATPAFGSTNNDNSTETPAPTFGSTNVPVAPAFGSTNNAIPAFGSTNATSTPAFGAAGSSTPVPAFGASNTFGTSAPAFGTPASSTPAPAFGGTDAAAPPAFGSSNGFGATSNPVPAFGASGSAPASSFGGFGTSGTPAPTFGASNAAPAPAFGTSNPFGASSAPAPAFGASGNVAAPSFGATVPSFGASNNAFPGQAPSVPAFGQQQPGAGFNVGSSSGNFAKKKQALRNRRRR